MTVERAQKLAAKLYAKYGVTHDPRVFACRICGVPQRWEHSFVTMGYAYRLCGLCFIVEDKAKRICWGHESGEICRHPGKDGKPQLPCVWPRWENTPDASL